VKVKDGIEVRDYLLNESLIAFGSSVDDGEFDKYGFVIIIIIIIIIVIIIIIIIIINYYYYY